MNMPINNLPSPEDFPDLFEMDVEGILAEMDKQSKENAENPVEDGEVNEENGEEIIEEAEPTEESDEPVEETDEEPEEESPAPVVPDKSAMKRILQKKERAVREKEQALRRREDDLVQRSQALEKDNDIVKAREIADCIKNGNFGKLFKAIGAKEDDFLSYYGIEKEKAGEVAMTAAMRAERSELEKKRQEAEAELKKANDVRAYNQAKQQLVTTVTKEIGQYKALAVLDLDEVLEDTEDAVIKVLNSGQANHLTLPEVVRDVLKYSNSKWSSRAERIGKMNNSTKPSSIAKGEREKPEVAGGKKADVKKPKTPSGNTISNKSNKPASSSKPRPKLLEWTPENSDEYDQAVLEQFFDK